MAEVGHKMCCPRVTIIAGRGGQYRCRFTESKRITTEDTAEAEGKEEALTLLAERETIPLFLHFRRLPCFQILEYQ